MLLSAIAKFLLLLLLLLQGLGSVGSYSLPSPVQCTLPSAEPLRGESPQGGRVYVLVPKSFLPSSRLQILASPDPKLCNESPLYRGACANQTMKAPETKFPGEGYTKKWGVVQVLPSWIMRKIADFRTYPTNISALGTWAIKSSTSQLTFLPVEAPNAHEFSASGKRGFVKKFSHRIPSVECIDNGDQTMATRIRG